MTTVEAFLNDEPLLKNGRYQIVPKGGDKPKAHTRVTNFAKKVEDEFAITQWKMRSVLTGAAGRPDIIAATLAAEGNAKALNGLAEQAMEATGANVRREMGTALHSLTEQADAGTLEVAMLPEPYRADIMAYLSCMDSLGAEVVEMESVVVHPALGLAGRFDRIVRIGGRLYVLDLKTGADLSHSWLSISIQLAIYAGAATVYDPASQTHRPMPDVHQGRGVVIHLLPGEATATAYWVDLNVGRRGIDVTETVMRWRKTKGVATPASNPVAELREYVVAHVASIIDAGHGGDLAKRWPFDVPVMSKYEGHTEAQLDEILEVCWTVEGHHKMPFIESSDPRVRDHKASNQKGKK
jgi:PD-(D/E)XK nuclease superfamily